MLTLRIEIPDLTAENNIAAFGIYISYRSSKFQASSDPFKDPDKRFFPLFTLIFDKTLADVTRIDFILTRRRQ